MNDSAIQVRGLSKRYRLGGQRGLDTSLREAVTAGAQRLLRRQPRPPRNSRDEFWALRDVSFDVAPGEVLGIIGHNGAGKSTLLKILSRITDPTAGEAVIRGRVASLLEVGTGFHPELSGRENVYLNGAILGMSRAEVKAQFDEIVDFSGVEAFLDTPVKRYSSGMRVRLAFAVAAHLQPEVLIVDEVLAVGDAAFQAKCMGKMSELAVGGSRTILFVSHNMAAVRQICHRAMLLKDGRVEFLGATPHTVDAYLRHLTTDADGDRGEAHFAEDAAPGGDEVRLLSVRTVGRSGGAQAAFDTGEPIDVELTYRVCREISDLRFVIKVVTRDDVIVFASTDHDLRPDGSRPGLFRSRCRIPGDLLNAGRYAIDVNAGSPGARILVPLQRHLHLTVVRSTSHGTAYTAGDWPGVVAPRLQWEIEAATEAPATMTRLVA